ncbi:MAG TPA: DM13 domain-containing protein [Acidimicrobiia bacterium]|nr:DM13 domain-containing protein [Acidimicrobiia bacterium]
MEFLRKYKWLIGGVGLVALVLAFLAFRPDKLFVDDVVDESLDEAFTSTAPDSTTTTTTLPSTTDESAASTTTSAPETATTAPAGPTVISEGTFFGIGHSAEGTTGVYELDGEFVLRFEDDTDIQNGPDLYVWFLEADAYEGGDPGAYLDLGTIKGNVGGQNYVLPAEYDPEVHRFVLIWCLRFSTPFAGSALA